MVVLGAAADLLAVADDEVAKLAAGVQLVQRAVGEIRSGHELEVHLDAALRLDVPGELDQRVRRVPGGLASVR
jgi:hypothetical protein